MASIEEKVEEQYKQILDTLGVRHYGKTEKINDSISAAIKNAAPNLKHPDREKCIYEFERFADMQDALLRKIKEEGNSYKPCFGF